MKKVALYVRVSTREQAEEGYSVGAQLEKMELYCKSKDWKIVDRYVDGGFSGSNLDRPEMKRLIADVSKNKLDMVLVYKLDRLSRSQKDTLYLIEEVFNANGIDFSSMQENFDTSTPLGMAMVGILSVFAQLERSQIAERMTMGKDAKVREGRYLGHARSPIGYEYDSVNGSLIPNEAEAFQVKLVYQLFTEENMSILAIQKYMNKHYSTRYGNYTADSTIRKILSNPIYTGRFSYKGEIYNSDHVPLVDDSTFNLAANLLASRQKERLSNSDNTPFARSTLLSGLLYCSRCGAGFCGTTHRHQHNNVKYTVKIYCCYTRKKSPRMMNSNKCKMRFLDREEMEEYVWNEVITLYEKLKSGRKKIWESEERREEILDRMKKAAAIRENGSLNEQRALMFYLIDKITVFQKRIKIDYRFKCTR